jgi:CBS domain-containing protein
MKLESILDHKGNEVVTITPDATVRTLVSLLSSRGIGAVVVSADGRHVDGIVSERDVVRAFAEDEAALDAPVRSVMTATVQCAPPDTSIDELMSVMTNQRIRHIPVTDLNGELAGIVSIGDIVKNRMGELEGERSALLDYIHRGG